MRTAIRDPRDLLARLQLPEHLLPGAAAAAAAFPLFVPLAYVDRMQIGDPHDPLLRQVLPLADETASVPGFTTDAVGDRPAQLAPGVLHKYEGRALLITTGACAVHCRYCFRRHYPYSESPRSAAAWGPALALVAADPSIDEVILSGGDPLMLVDSQLAELAERVAAIPHVHRLRLHTRLPLMIPERVNNELLSWLRSTRLTPLVVVHANHPTELGDDATDPVAQSLARLVDAGIPVLNQAVLLAGVNDTAAVLIDLCRRLINLRVLPYYLHQLDRVAGAAHFEVPAERGQSLLAELRAALPGYAVPRYVREVPGAASKVTIG